MSAVLDAIRHERGDLEAKVAELQARADALHARLAVLAEVEQVAAPLDEPLAAADGPAPAAAAAASDPPPIASAPAVVERAARRRKVVNGVSVEQAIEQLGGEATSTQLADATGIHKTQVHARLNQLLGDKAIVVLRKDGRARIFGFPRSSAAPAVPAVSPRVRRELDREDVPPAARAPVAAKRKLSDDEQRLATISHEILELLAHAPATPDAIAGDLMRNKQEVRSLLRELAHRGRAEQRGDTWHLTPAATAAAA